MARSVVLDGDHLRSADVASVAMGARATVPSRALRRMRRSRATVEKLARSGATAYAITTGVGDLARVRIKPGDIRQLQLNLVKSHAAGVGDPLPTEVVRAAMAIRANTLAKGFSGVRPAVVTTLVRMLERGVHPVVPGKGSLGASGDLAPLAHLALPTIGMGTAEFRGRTLPGAQAMRRAKIPLLELHSKEGVALLNGTSFMAAIAALVVEEAYDLLLDAQIAAAMSTEALLGTDQAFRPEVGKLRPHPGQVTVAANLFRLLRGSEILRSHRRSAHRVQDPYSIRCLPQVLGASLDVVTWVEKLVTTEINSVTDNPLVLPGKGVLSAGNFHGQILAYAMDFLGIALAEVASIAERRVDRMLDSRRSELKPFLSPRGGVNSGLMAAQYTAAALVSENKILAHPASVDSIPTSANQEDHVSMGMTAGLKLLVILKNVRTVVAIEALTAAQALEFRKPLRPGKGPAAALAAVRKKVPPLGEDRVLAPDVERVIKILVSGELRAALARAKISLQRIPKTR